MPGSETSRSSLPLLEKRRLVLQSATTYIQELASVVRPQSGNTEKDVNPAGIAEIGK
ncbi:MAG: hypothetical protein GQ542_03130 [Desulforhopalus sp.]|nr:hypothetical protein [Desulforhopalus sp.]